MPHGSSRLINELLWTGLTRLTKIEIRNRLRLLFCQSCKSCLRILRRNNHAEIRYRTRDSRRGKPFIAGIAGDFTEIMLGAAEPWAADSVGRKLCHGR